MNIFQLIGDQLRLFALILLVLKIIKTRSCSGISGKTQILFALVFTFRYFDVFTYYISAYNTTLKIVYTSITYMTLFCVYVLYEKTYERERDTCRMEYLLIPAVLLALLINHEFSLLEVCWTFSIYLETVAIIPQFVFVLKSGEIDAVMFSYVCLMASSRCIFYISNWAYRYYYEGHHYDPIAISAAAVETIIYLDFFTRGLRKLKHKKAYQKNLELILNSPENVIIGDKSLQKEKQPNSVNQELQKVFVDENNHSDMKNVDLAEIPKVHVIKQ